MNDYDPILHRLDADWRASHERVRQVILEAGGPAKLAELDAKMRDVNSGVERARNIWHSISPAQRQALVLMEKHGDLAQRFGVNAWSTRGREGKAKLSTLQALADRDLIAWDDCILAAKIRAVLTEHGQFVVRWGRKSDACSYPEA